MNDVQMQKIQDKIMLKEEMLMLSIFEYFNNHLPENVHQWFSKTNSEEVKVILQQVMSKVIEESICNILKDSEIKDTIIGETVDQVKNLVILKYKYLLLSGKDVEINDEEIKSEVIDYLFKNKYKIKVTNNKIELL